MNITRKLTANQLKLAIVQLVGEMRDMSHDARIADIAAYLRCTKQTAKKHIDKTVWAYAIKCVEHEYRKPTEKNPQGAKLFTYELTEHGARLFNSIHAKDVKNLIAMYKDDM